MQYKDPDAKLAVNPNHQAYDQLQKKEIGTAAGAMSDLRRSSPSGHQVSQTRNRHSALGGNESMTRIGQESAGRAANAMINDYKQEYGTSI